MHIAHPFRVGSLILPLLLAAVDVSRADATTFVQVSGFPKGDAITKGYEGWYRLSGSMAWRATGEVVSGGWISSHSPLYLTTAGDPSLMVSSLKDFTKADQPKRTVTLHVLKFTDKTTYAFYRVTLEGARISRVGFSSEFGNLPLCELELEYDRIRIGHHYENAKLPALLGGLGALGTGVLSEGTGLEPVTAYADFAAQQVTVTGVSAAVTNETPSISSIADLSWSENRTGIVRFQARDDKTSPQNLTLWAQAANPLLLPDDAFTFRPVATNTFELAMAPTRNTSGETDVILRVSDGTGYSENRFHATVTAGAKVPQISPALQNVRMNVNQSVDVAFAIVDLDTAVTNLVLSVTSTNTNLFPQASLTVTATGTLDRRLTLAPPAGQYGSAQITLSLTDGLFTTQQTFAVAVNGLTAGAPTNITLPIEILDLLNEGVPTGTILGTLTATDPTPGDTHTFTMLDGAGGRFAITNLNQLVVAGGGALLNYEKAQRHTVLIQATDAAGNQYARAFQLFLNLNDSPAFRIFKAPWFVNPGTPSPVPASVATDEDAGFVYPVRLTLACTGGTLLVATNTLSAGSVTGNGTASVTVSALINPITTLLNTPGTVTYTPSAGFAGPFSVTLVLNDLNSQTTTAIGVYPDYVARSATLVHDGFVLPSDLSSWSLGQYGNDVFDGALESSIWGVATDRDGDGFANLLEYGLGYDNTTLNSGNPLEGSTQVVAPGLAALGGTMVTESADPGVQYNVISFIVREDPRLVAWVEAANRLTPLPDWSSDVSQIERIGRQSLGDGFERLTFRDPDPNKPYRVYRLGMSYLAAPGGGL